MINLVVTKTRYNFLKHDFIKCLVKLAVKRGVDLYLVGGTVRDILLGKEVKDLDFAMDANAFDFARELADLLNASFIPLDEEHDTARVVFNMDCTLKCPYMDFCRIRGADITEDMSTRDFTVNAMAIDLQQVVENDQVELIDPYDGSSDLVDKIIRLVSNGGISDDPIRLLRAYRLSADLDFVIHNDTLAIIRKSVGLLNLTSAERIRDELFKTLSADNSSHYLREMDEMGLLEEIFPEIAPMRGMEQNDYHHLDVWDHSMLTLEFLEKEPIPDFSSDHPHSVLSRGRETQINIYYTEVEKYLSYELVKSRPVKLLLKLAALLHDVGKPITRSIDRNGRLRFFDHNLEGAQMMIHIGKRLRLAKREISSLSDMVKYHMLPLGLLVYMKKNKSAKDLNRAMRRYLQKTRAEWLNILLLSYADLRATQGPRREADDLIKLEWLMGKIADMYFQEIRSPVPRLIDGNDIMEEFHLPSSPAIGGLLRQVKEAQMDGKVKTREDAMEMLRDILKRG
jgi:poly(A) polymerase